MKAKRRHDAPTGHAAVSRLWPILPLLAACGQAVTTKTTLEARKPAASPVERGTGDTTTPEEPVTTGPDTVDTGDPAPEPTPEAPVLTDNESPLSPEPDLSDGFEPSGVASLTSSEVQNLIAKADRVLYVNGTTGRDSGTGASTSPFKTIGRCAALAQPGTACVIAPGTYRETVRASQSGTADKPIRFIAQNKVIISGLQPVKTAWRDKGSGIWETTIALPVAGYNDAGFFANQLMDGSTIVHEARFPNLEPGRYFPRMSKPDMIGGGIARVSDFELKLTNAQLAQFGDQLLGTTMWTSQWYLARTATVIQNLGGGAYLAKPATRVGSQAGYWHYFTGSLAFLDAPGEWHYAGETKTLTYKSLDGLKPVNLKYKARNTAIDLSGASHVHFSGFDVTAANAVMAGEGNVLDKMRFRYVSHHMTLPTLPEAERYRMPDGGYDIASHAHDTGIIVKGNGNTITSTFISDSSGNGIVLYGTNHRIENNVILNTNVGGNYNAAVRLNGTGHKILRNTLKTTGRDLVLWDYHTAGTKAENLEIAHNDFSGWGQLNQDNGAIYICCNAIANGTEIHHNVFHTPRGDLHYDVTGIYFDNGSYGGTIHHNLVTKLNVPRPVSAKLAGKPERGGIQFKIYFNTFFDRAAGGTNKESLANVFAGPAPASAADLATSIGDVFATQAPAFSSPETRDYRPAPGSPQLDAVTPSTLTNEYRSTYRGTKPDAGAFEAEMPTWSAGSSLPDAATINFLK